MSLECKKFKQLESNEVVLSKKHYIKNNGNFELFEGIGGLKASSYSIKIFKKVGR